jgi:hypothetical protein
VGTAILCLQVRNELFQVLIHRVPLLRADLCEQFWSR